MNFKSFVIIGSGNVATHLGLNLRLRKKNIIKVFSKTIEHAKTLGESLDCSFTDDLNQLPEADIYIVAVTDSSIESVVSKLNISKASFIVHTAGSIDMEILKASNNYGVMYPLQTLSKYKEIDFYNKVPLCVEANTQENCDILYDFAKEFSSDVFRIDSLERKLLHLAAIFASNFTNYLYYIAEDILKTNKISIDILKPIILETAEKYEIEDKLNTLTGPAVRGDTEVINKHLELLGQFTDYKDVYEILSRKIVKLKYDKL